MRRRAIVGTAAVGGAAYVAGKRHERRSEDEMAAQEPAVEYAPPPAPPAQAEQAPLDELERLAKLHEEGILTDEEFSAAKARQLGIDQ